MLTERRAVEEARPEVIGGRARRVVAWLLVGCVVLGAAASRGDDTDVRATAEIVEASAAAAVAITASDGVADVQVSGVLIDAAGLVMTVAHGLENVRNVTIHLKDGTRHKGILVGLEKAVDVALFKIENAPKLPHAVMGDATELEPGDPVVLIGAPLGLSWSVSQGIVSSTERVYEGQWLIQTDADVNPGSSGAPVFDKHGLLVALVKGRIPTSGANRPAEGLNFLVPINATFQLLDKLGVSSRSRRLVQRGLHTTDVRQRIEMLEAAVRADPSNAEACFYLGVAYGDVEDWANQLAWFKRFAELRPNSFQAHRNLAISYLETDNLDAALQHLLKAAALRPTSARVHNDLGETYRRMGRYQEARDELERALELDPSLAEAHFNLGLVLATGFNDAVGAARHFEKYLDLRPGNKDVDEVRRWLGRHELKGSTPGTESR